MNAKVISVTAFSSHTLRFTPKLGLHPRRMDVMQRSARTMRTKLACSDVNAIMNHEHKPTHFFIGELSAVESSNVNIQKLLSKVDLGFWPT